MRRKDPPPLLRTQGETRLRRGRSLLRERKRTAWKNSERKGEGIKHSILMHIIIILSVYLSFYRKVIIISKYIHLGVIMIN